MSNRKKSDANATATVEAKPLRAALAAVASAVARHTTIPILTHVLIEVRASAPSGQMAMAITGTDLERELHTSLPVDPLSTPLRCAVPAAMFGEIVKRLPDGADVTLTLDAADGTLRIAGGRAKFALRTLAAEDFPVFSEGGEGSVDVAMPAAELGAMLAAVAPAMSREETRYYLNGAFLTPHQGVLRAVATGGHRLVQCDRDLPAGGERLPRVIVPRSSVAEMIRMCQEADQDEIGLAVSPTRIVLTTAHRRLATKLIYGTYPDYARVVPQEAPRTTVSIDVDEFTRAIGRVDTVGTKGPLKIDVSAAGLALSMRNPEGHEASDALDAAVTGEDLTIGFQPDYLISAIEAHGVDQVTLLFGGPGMPLRVVADGSRTLAVLMPMRVS